MNELLYELSRVGIIAVIRAPDSERALLAIDALVSGGVTGIEVTYSTPDAPSVISELDKRYGEGILMGAGTVLTPTQAQEAVQAGARYLVCPGASPELAAAMQATGAGILLGAMTPTEVMAVLGMGTDAVKLFPSSLGGTAFLRALRGPFPNVPFVPTGGVNVDNLREWFAAGALAVGAGGELCSSEDIKFERYAEIRTKAAAFVAAIADRQVH